MIRSNQPHVRNPILGLPAVVTALQDLSQKERAFLRITCKCIALDARERAEKCWRTHKGPMALYWKCVSVYTNHIARALKEA